MKKGKPTITPIITGIHPPMQKEKKILRLHKHPDQIKASIKDLIEMSEEEDIKHLFEDISTLVGWALERLPLAPPKKKDESEDPS